jgi:hypothetical protein
MIVDIRWYGIRLQFREENGPWLDVPCVIDEPAPPSLDPVHEEIRDLGNEG